MECAVRAGSAWPCGPGSWVAWCMWGQHGHVVVDVLVQHVTPPPTHPRNGLLPPSPIRQTINYIGCYYTDVMLQTKAERKVRELGARVLSVCCHTARPPLPTSY